jgi:thiol-disulfide isomerase/thioredoxin
MGSLALAVLLMGPGHARPEGVRWEHKFDEALKKARAAQKPIMVDFWADWCGWCHQLDKTTYVDPQVVKLSAEFVPVKVNTEGARRDAEIAVRYNVTSLPTIAFLSPSGRQISRLNGFQGPGQFPFTMETARATASRVMAWEAALEKDAKDPGALAGLGVHMFDQEFYEESLELLLRAARVDDRRTSGERKQTRLILGIIQRYDRKFAEAETVLKEGLALRPAHDLDPKMMYVLGSLYAKWGRKDDARLLLRQVVVDYADSSVAQKARESLKSLDSPRKEH